MFPPHSLPNETDRHKACSCRILSSALPFLTVFLGMGLHSEEDHMVDAHSEAFLEKGN
jgi:hypothetical protein